jgi:hypothetical protein
MRPDAPYFIFLLCLTPDDFARQEKSVDTQWVKYWFTQAGNLKTEALVRGDLIGHILVLYLRIMQLIMSDAR